MLLKMCVRLSYDKVGTHPENKKHFSFIIQRNTVLAVGSNCRVEHDCIYPLRTYHSEYVAWKRGARRIDTRKPWYIINVRIGRDMAIHLSKPCTICQHLLKSVGCSRVVYTIDERTSACMRL